MYWWIQALGEGIYERLSNFFFIDADFEILGKFCEKLLGLKGERKCLYLFFDNFLPFCFNALRRYDIGAKS